MRGAFDRSIALAVQERHGCYGGTGIPAATASMTADAALIALITLNGLRPLGR